MTAYQHASDIEHFWLNMFNNYYCKILLCASKLNKVNEEGNNNFQFSPPLIHFRGHQCNKDIFIQHTKNNKFENKKKLVLKCKAKVMHLQTKQVKATQLIDENESKKDALSEARDFGNSNQLHLKDLYAECYPRHLAPNPEMKAVSYAGKTFGRCSLLFLSCLRHHAPEVLCI